MPQLTLGLLVHSDQTHETAKSNKVSVSTEMLVQMNQTFLYEAVY